MVVVGGTGVHVGLTPCRCGYAAVSSSRGIAVRLALCSGKGSDLRPACFLITASNRDLRPRCWWFRGILRSSAQFELRATRDPIFHRQWGSAPIQLAAVPRVYQLVFYAPMHLLFRPAVRTGSESANALNR